MPLSSEIRAHLDHPIIDADGHLVEVMPIFDDYLQRIAGKDVAARYTEVGGWSGAPDPPRLVATDPPRAPATPGRRTDLVARADRCARPCHRVHPLAPLQPSR